MDTQADCADNGFAYANVVPGTPDPDQAVNPGQVDGEGCVYPSSVQDDRLPARRQVPAEQQDPRRLVAAYEQDMGNTPPTTAARRTPRAAPTAPTPASVPQTRPRWPRPDQYTTRHNPFVWFHSVIDNTAECDANVVPRDPGRQRRAVACRAPRPRTSGARRQPRASGSSRPTCATTATTAPAPAQTAPGPRRWTDRGRRVPPGLDAPRLGLPGLQARRHAGRHHIRRIRCRRSRRGRRPVATRPRGRTPTRRATLATPRTVRPPAEDRSAPSCSNAKYIVEGSTDTTGSYNHYSALRSYEDSSG